MLPVCLFIWNFPSGPAVLQPSNDWQQMCRQGSVSYSNTTIVQSSLRLLFCWFRDFKTQSWKHQQFHRAACLKWTVSKVCLKGFYTHHRSQVIVLHQLEGAFVAWFEVISLELAHISSGDWADSMDHIWKKKKKQSVLCLYIVNKLKALCV